MTQISNRSSYRIYKWRWFIAFGDLNKIQINNLRTSRSNILGVNNSPLLFY